MNDHTFLFNMTSHVLTYLLIVILIKTNLDISFFLHLQDASDNVVNWSEKTRIDGHKTKEMMITFQHNPLLIPPLNINRIVLEKVKSSKFTGINYL